MSTLARRVVKAGLRSLRDGEIELREGNRRETFGSAPTGRDLRTIITVHHPAFWRTVALGGSIGAAEAYARGHWSCDDLTTLVRILARNRDTGVSLNRGFARLGTLVDRLWHAVHPNTLKGSRSNIASHYDLGNEFFEAFLDETMSYSCGVFERGGESLADASRRKNELVCRRLDLGPGDEILEIGGGWGGFAIHAATRHGCRVTTTTVSPRQHEYAVARVREAGLVDRIEVLLIDYRELSGLGRRFDKLVSIEMIEAVGHRFFDTYFRVCSDLLRPHGAMMLQAITIADAYYDSYKRGVDFIQRYIFPGGCLPSLGAIRDSVSRVTDLRVAKVDDITSSYVITLKRWRARFRRNLDRIRAMGYPDALLRMWEFYFCYCEGGFAERTIGDVQLVLEKPRSSVAGLVPQALGGQRP